MRAADPPPGRRGHHGAALQPPAAGGAGTVRPRGDRRPRPRRLRGRAGRPAPPGRGGLPAAHAPTTSARWSWRAPSRASSTRTPASTASTSRPRSSDVGELSLALGAAGIGILALTPELATLEDLFFRLTEGTRGRRAPEPATRRLAPRRDARRTAEQRLDRRRGAGRLPARAPRPSTRRSTAGSCASSSPRSAPIWASRWSAILPLFFVIFQNVHQHHHGGADSIFAAQITQSGPRHAGADAAVPVGLHAAADRRRWSRATSSPTRTATAR